MNVSDSIKIRGAFEHNLKGLNLEIERGAMTVVTGVSGSGKSSLAFDTVLAEAQRRFFYTLSNYSRQFLDLGSRPAVKQISGLSPAVALAQNETMPSRRATVGTLSDVAELIGVMLARFGDQRCPDHMLPTSKQDIPGIVDRLVETMAGKTVAICSPLVEQKKGHFATQMRRIAAKGYSRAYIDGEIVDLDPIPELVKEEKHTIKIIVDAVKVSAKSRARLERSFAAALELNESHGEYYQMPSARRLDLDTGGSFSLQGGCPTCGYSWPMLDSRYFSANSLGRCDECDGYGVLDIIEYDEEYGEDVAYEADSGSLVEADSRCGSCEGTGLDPQTRAITVGGKSAPEMHAMVVEDLLTFWRSFEDPRFNENPALQRVRQQIIDNLDRIQEVGLGYLQLMRRVRSLSGGEAQRLKLAGILGENLKGILYILDEPSQGLHPVEIDRLCASLKDLKNQGNTVIVVDHDETLMRYADWVIDLGPGGGADGGNLLAKFPPASAKDYAKISRTAYHLAGRAKFSFNERDEARNRGVIAIKAPHHHNLKMDAVSFQKGQLNIVTGVSGAGKSSLVLATLYENAADEIDRLNNGAKRKKDQFKYCDGIEGLDDYTSVHLIDRKPVAKSSVSMPATYLDIFTDLRNFYGKLPAAQVAGLTAASFSLAREGGRCEECKGRGQISLKMRFLADAKVKCHICNGMRYRPHLLDIKYNGYSLAEILNLTISEAGEHFKTFRKVQKRLQPAIELGLGYLKVGQPSSSLSGGEAQRLKLAPFLAKSFSEQSLIILDEPTTGLHFEDVARLTKCMRSLVNAGATVVMIEHNLDVIAEADWLVDLGPGSSADGGRLLYQGVPERYSDRGTPTGSLLG